MAEALGGVTDIVFEMSGVDYVSSAGLRILLASYKLMDKRGGSMKIVHVDESVMSVLEMSGFAALFEIE